MQYCYKIQYKNRRKRQNRYPNIQICDLSLSCVGTSTSIKSGGFALVYRPKHPLLAVTCNPQDSVTKTGAKYKMMVAKYM
jgi:hypothetical protein